MCEPDSGPDIERASITRIAASNCSLVNRCDGLRAEGRASSEGIVAPGPVELFGMIVMTCSCCGLLMAGATAYSLPLGTPIGRLRMVL